MAIERDSIKLAPSILAADFARLAEQVAEADKAGADRIHVDVMDGHFVPNLSMGVPVVQSLRHITRLPLETSLMIRNPDQSLEAFASAGSDFLWLCIGRGTTISIALSAESKSWENARVLRFNPATAAAVLEEILPEINLVLVMTVKSRFWTPAIPSRHVAKDPTRSPDDRVSKNFL